MSIDWTNPHHRISKYFTVSEAIYLPKWKRLATEDELTDITKGNLVQLFAKLDIIREFFGAPIIIHCAFRPGPYNKLVGGALNSTHMFGMAADFHVRIAYDCDKQREMLLPMLAELKLRMENLPGSDWIHVDTRKPSDETRRFFKPQSLSNYSET